MLLLSRFEVSGHSMVPSLLPGDEILVSSIPYLFKSPRLNEIVLLSDPHSKKRMLKRIEQIDGDRLYVKGDNPSDSHDSRHFGWVLRRFIIGKMIYKLS